MQNQLPPSILSQQPNNVGGISGIIKRNKYAPQPIIPEETSGNGMRLPKLNNPRVNLEHNNQMLPSIGGIPSVNG